jgi:hypothetical protein
LYIAGTVYAIETAKNFVGFIAKIIGEKVMKMTVALFGMLIIGSALFAQTFSIDGHLATDFESVAPTVGFEINFSKIDILAGVKFWIYEQNRADENYQEFNTDNVLKEHRFEIFAGIAPKAIITEKWSLTFPLLAKTSFRNDELEYDDSLRILRIVDLWT